MGFRTMAVGIATAATILVSGVTAGTFGPEHIVETFRDRMAEKHYFIVSFHPQTKSETALPADVLVAKSTVNLPHLSSAVVMLRAQHAFKLADIAGVEWVWYLHPDEMEITRIVMQKLNHALEQGALVTHMSLDPPSSFYRKEPDFDAPVPRATLRMARQGRLVITAIGDAGDKARGLVNPWSIPPWVLSVGAWDHRSDAVWEHSSTGNPKMPHTWPDVIAPGVNVIEPIISARAKTDAERAFDEGNARFKQSVPKEVWDKYTMRAGSAVAAGQVTNAAGQVALFLTGLIKERNPQEGERLFSITVGPERITAHDKVVPRLTGRATSTSNGGMEYTYWLDQPWKMIKQILTDTALPVPDAQPWEAGAGVVDPTYIRAEFGKYGISISQIMAVKALE